MKNNRFEELGLNNDILDALTVLGYDEPTEVQEMVIPYILNGKDVIVKSQTGSGKTAAFGIPICQVAEIDSRKPQALVLAPTRELAVQVKEEISYIGRYKRIRCAAVFGKQPMTVQVRELKQRIHVVTGTPGRVADHMDRGTIDLDGIQYLIIDEADKMLSMGFIDQLESIVSRLPEKRTTVLLSATLPTEIEQLCQKYMRNPQHVEIEHEHKASERIEQYCHETSETEKFRLLCNLIYAEKPENGIIFLNTKDAVDRLTTHMKREGFSCNSLHGGMDQRERLEVMDSFKRGAFRYLVATDVAARGIHIDEIAIVINYDIPLEMESYVHRIGRTGRVGGSGKAITFCTPFQHRFLRDIEEYVGYEIPFQEKPSDALLDENKQNYSEKYKYDTVPVKSIASEKSYKINKGIMKLYLGAGKKKKMRPGDIVGAITNIDGISQEDIGIIDIQDNVSYVDILNNKGAKVLAELQKGTIKGKTVKVQKAKMKQD